VDLILRVLNGVRLNRIEGRANMLDSILDEAIKCSSLPFIFTKFKTLNMEKLSIFAAVAS
jgi:hypothetical protein